MSDHVIPARIYYLVFATLLLLTLLTVEVAFYDLGILTFQVALLIAGTKAMLVILYFMHVRYSGGLTGIFVGAGFIFLAILLLFTLFDVASRPWQYQPDDSGFSQSMPPFRTGGWRNGHERSAPDWMKVAVVSGFEFRVSRDRASLVDFLGS